MRPGLMASSRKGQKGGSVATETHHASNCQVIGIVGLCRVSHPPLKNAIAF
jgi:hypothetical protein